MPESAMKAPNANRSAIKTHSCIDVFGLRRYGFRFTGGFEVFGRRYPSLPFEIIWANDLNAEACKTYQRNLGHEIHRGDIWDLMASMPKKADVLIGGFPCQDISVNGKHLGSTETEADYIKPWWRQFG